jgi:hypothetical protein
MAGAGKGSKSGDVKESTDSSTTIEEDEKGTGPDESRQVSGLRGGLDHGLAKDSTLL